MYKQPTAEIKNFYGTLLPKNRAATVAEWEHGFPVCMPVGSGFRSPARPYAFRKSIPKVGRVPGKSKKILYVDDFLPNLIENNSNATPTIFGIENYLDIYTSMSQYSPYRSEIIGDDYPRFRNTRSTPFVNRGINKKLLKKRITKCVAHVLENFTKSSNWDPESGYLLTDENIIASINMEFLKRFRVIRNLAGDPYSFADMVNAIRNRLMSGESADFDIDYLEDLYMHQQAVVEQELLPFYHRSRDHATNALFSSSYMQLFFRSLDYKAEGITAVTQKILKRKPCSSTNVHRRLLVGDSQYIPVGLRETIPIVEDGTQKSITVNGLNTIPLVQDGATTEFELKSELDRAFFLSEKDRQRVLGFLEVNGQITLSVSSTFDRNVEFSNNLNTNGTDDRSDYYVLKLDPTTISTRTTAAPMVSRNTMSYTLLSESDIPDWFEDKVSLAVFCMSHDDLALDHLIDSEKCSISFQDIDISSWGPKDNVEIPLYGGFLPTTIVIVPTDKTKYNLFGARSYLNQFDRETNIVERRLDYTSIPDGRIADTDVAKLFTLAEDPSEYKVTCTFNGTEDIYTEAKSSTGLARSKTGLRVMTEIINELYLNYNLEGGLSWFDITSRMTQTEYITSHFLDNAQMVFDYYKDGGLGPKIFNDFKKDEVVKTTRTRLKSKKTDIITDKYLPIRGIPVFDRRNGEPVGDTRLEYKIISPPTSEVAASLVDPSTIEQATDRDTYSRVLFTNFYPT